MDNSFTELLESFHFTENMLWIAFVFFILFYGICSAVLVFHWKKYGMKNSTILFTEVLFFLGSALFFFMAFLGLSILSV